ncbi:hypothetical protein ACIBM4_14280 [Streptomyces sp. NPDC050256]|uniref:hypothetical protein n=1 Tax=Streptomyces sp. NPDC050256 TaxID=3365607 RepID=UPI003788698C
MRIVTGLDQFSPMAVQWTRAWPPPSLLERYDGLAQLGFAVVAGGPEAWRWREETTEQGEFMLAGLADIRPLLADDVDALDRAAAGPPAEN